MHHNRSDAAFRYTRHAIPEVSRSTSMAHAMIRRAFASIDYPILYRLANKNPIKIRIMSAEQASAIKLRCTSLEIASRERGGEGENYITREVSRRAEFPFIADEEWPPRDSFQLTLAN